MAEENSNSEMEIQLAPSDEGQWDSDAKTSLTDSSETNPGFASEEYVPGATEEYVENQEEKSPEKEAPKPKVKASAQERIKRTSILFVFLLVVSGGAYLILEEEHLVDTMVSMVLGEDEIAQPIPRKRTKKKKKAVVKDRLPSLDERITKEIEMADDDLPASTTGVETSAKKIVTMLGKEDFSKLPYHWLPNEKPLRESLDQELDSEVEENWKEVIRIGSPAQRYVVVSEIKQEKIHQSRHILLDVLENSDYKQKLWIRMRAIMGLAEFGEALNLKDVKKAVGTPEHKDLLANFVKRFRHRSSSGERYILRYVIRMVDAKGRFHILKTLQNAGLEVEDNALYFLAAREDYNPRIRKYVENYLSKNVKPEDLASMESRYQEQKNLPAKH